MSHIKKFGLLLFLILASGESFGQCLSFQDMLMLFHADYEGQDAIIEAKGYYLNKLPFRQLAWKSKKGSDSFVYTDFTPGGKVRDVGQQGSSIKSCYDAAKAEITSAISISAGFRKDGEDISSDGDLSLYYSNEVFGVVLSKGHKKSDDSGLPYYYVEVMSKPWYLELTKNKFGN